MKVGNEIVIFSIRCKNLEEDNVLAIILMLKPS